MTQARRALVHRQISLAQGGAPHSGSMLEQVPTLAQTSGIKFEPVRDAYGAGWNIRAFLPDGRRPFVLGFESEAAARAWIEHAAVAWARKYAVGG